MMVVVTKRVAGDGRIASGGAVKQKAIAKGCCALEEAAIETRLR